MGRHREAEDPAEVSADRARVEALIASLPRLRPEEVGEPPDPTDRAAWHAWAARCRTSWLADGASEARADLAWGWLITRRLADKRVVDEVRARAERYAARRVRLAEYQRRRKDQGYQARARKAGRSPEGGWSERAAAMEVEGRRRVAAMIASGVPIERAVELENLRTREVVYAGG